MRTASESIYRRSARNASWIRHVLRCRAQQWLDAEQLIDYELAVGELLANAVEHGSGETIRVACWYEHPSLITEVSDSGAGPTFSDNPALRTNGRGRGFGLFLIRTLVDELQLVDGGKKARLRKIVYRHQIPKADSTLARSP